MGWTRSLGLEGNGCTGRYSSSLVGKLLENGHLGDRGDEGIAVKWILSKYVVRISAKWT
jgi:hypothetical protein